MAGMKGKLPEIGVLAGALMTALSKTDKTILICDDEPQETFLIENPYAHLQAIPESRFKCKGKHEYRKNNNGDWVCQCGRKI